MFEICDWNTPAPLSALSCRVGTAQKPSDCVGTAGAFHAQAGDVPVGCPGASRERGSMPSSATTVHPMATQAQQQQCKSQTRAVTRNNKRNHNSREKSSSRSATADRAQVAQVLHVSHPSCFASE